MPITMLRENKPFAFSRWGDGEWRAVLGLKGEHQSNCDGHRYFESMCGALRKVLSSRPEYLLGMQSLAMREYGKEIRDWLKMDGMSPEDFINADVFHKAAQAGDWRFMDYFTAGPHIIVGPRHLRKAFKTDNFVEVPDKDCWLATTEVLKEIRGLLQMAPFTKVGFCSSMAANVWIDNLWDGRHAFVDFGSVFDPLAGVLSRKYMRK